MAALHPRGVSHWGVVVWLPRALWALFGGFPPSGAAMIYTAHVEILHLTYSTQAARCDTYTLPNPHISARWGPLSFFCALRVG